jgi:hypothetical protein
MLILTWAGLYLIVGIIYGLAGANVVLEINDEVPIPIILAMIAYLTFLWPVDFLFSLFYSFHKGK